MRELADRIGYCFVAEEIRAAVFTHRSFRHENHDSPALDNERLEFLGDAVLGFVVSRLLFDRYEDKREGDLSRLRANLVSAEHLAGKARALELGQDLRLGRGEEMSGGRDKDSILADVYESLIAGIFLDGGLVAAERFVAGEFQRDIEEVVATTPKRDFKSQLQEALHAAGLGEPRYRVVEEAGPDHHKVFDVAVVVNGGDVGRGIGRSKKTAEQEAARAAFEQLGLRPAEAES